MTLVFIGLRFEVAIGAAQNEIYRRMLD